VSEAYLDIETTGLSSFNNYITVIGIYLVNGGRAKMVQLVGRDVTRQNLLAALDGVHTIYTYNGKRFDLPFIRDYLDIDLNERYHHHDLMYDCWRCNLFGGFKSVEVQLGIPRKLKGIGGFEAVTLWWQYLNDDNRRALKVLLHYNQEDVINLKALRERLPVEED
jgi:uncharacterized protein YprB with RNaseH-like and TPR domain